MTEKTPNRQGAASGEPLGGVAEEKSESYSNVSITASVDERLRGLSRKKQDDDDFESEEHRKLSATSRKYDGGNKGFLTDAERRMREMDTSNRGQLTNEQVVQVVEQTMAIREANIKLRNLVIGMFVAVVVLGLANVGTALAAARLAKDTETDSGTGEMKVKGSSVSIVTRGKGGSLTVRAHVFGDQVVYCTNTESMARLYSTNRKGVVVSVVLENSFDDTTQALGIDRSGASFNSTSVLLRTHDGSQILFDMTSSVCDEIYGHSPQGNRDLEESHPHLRYQKFLRHLDEDRILGEEIVEVVPAPSPVLQVPTHRQLQWPALSPGGGGGDPPFDPCANGGCQTQAVP